MSSWVKKIAMEGMLRSKTDSPSYEMYRMALFRIKKGEGCSGAELYDFMEKTKPTKKPNYRK